MGLARYVPQRRYRLMGLLRLGEMPPPRTVGARQVDVPPAACAKCGSGEIFADALEPRRLYCFGCGWDAWLVRPAWEG